MAAKKLVYIITFNGQGPVWKVFDGDSISECEEPGVKDRNPVVALIPDPLFFFFKPKGVDKSRHAKSATMMQMNYSFPGGEEGGFKVLKPAGNAVLGYTSHDLLPQFMERHREVLARATVVTTAFAVCWRAAIAEGLSVWSWKGQGGIKILSAMEDMTYFKGSEDEFRKRFESLGLDGEPEQMDLEQACKIFRRKKIRWARLGLVTAGNGKSDKASVIDFKPYIAAAVMVTLVGALFIAGQYRRWQVKHDEAGQWRAKLRQLYVSALGPNPGGDPYGTILYKLDQMKNGGGGNGVDVLGLLATISENAPVGIVVESLNLGTDSGNIRGMVSTYDDLDEMMENLSTNGRYKFVLEQADNVDNGISFSLRAEYNR